MLTYIECDLREGAFKLFVADGIGQLEELLAKYARFQELHPE